MKFVLRTLLLVLIAGTAARADLLPDRIDPPAPFPRILEQAPTIENIAPGVDYGDYQLLTEVGPLAIHVVAVDLRRGDVRLANVLADDQLDSRGETVGSMAKRTRAIAGINGDYFDIGNTNRPENIVVRNGTLVQLPTKRYALAITREGSARIAEFSFSGEMQLADRTVTLDSVDGLPPFGDGIALLTPQYGSVAPHDDLTLVNLEPLGGDPPLTRYRITGTADNLVTQRPGYYIAIGANVSSAVDEFASGGVVAVDGNLAPLQLSSIETAIGGGPMILHAGEWYDDGDGPNGHEFAKRIPCTGAAIGPHGRRLFLIEVDGRQPDVSVGLKRPEFAALMRGLGATEGMALDGGGSSTIAVRRVGEGEAGMVNSPSDGIERPVGDGLLVYSTAPSGPAVRLVARPGVVRAVPGAMVGLRIAAVDAANHLAAGGEPMRAEVTPASLGVFRDGEFIAEHPGEGRLTLRSGSLHGEVGIEVDAMPARTKITPMRPNVESNAIIALTAHAYDARGYALDLPAQLPWTASAGSIDARGQYRAGSKNADVSVRIADALAIERVTVGSHDVALPFAAAARFVTLPHGGEGSIAKGAGCESCLAFSFAFSGRERAAYAMADLPLPENTIGVTFDLQDDGSAARVRVALRNEINEDVLLDATPLGDAGWRRVTVRFPADVQASRLLAIYVLPSKGIELSEGSIVLRNVRAIVAGR